ncbi:endonuclease/exonuclease/phosphatase family protein [Nocardioides speluncae]|uniref:endonuclease/exonuclease/phosphatase family protein n=1 Tax=Nocardioides speluncae TaxID=2670337 RepID=UPI000D6857C6|nr:endonuclease/exonuclease/phosphatase family protein [Nocardioides speluncae]
MPAAPSTPARPAEGARDRWAWVSWRSGWVLAGIAVLTAALMALHRKVPNSPGNLGSLLETFLPWLGVMIPVLAIGAVVRRSAPAALALVLPLVVWVGMFGNAVLPGKGGGSHDLRVVSHNVDAGNADHDGTVQELLAADADVVALEELDEDAKSAYQGGLDEDFEHNVTRGTVGLWSRFPISDAEDIDVGFGWTRAMRAKVKTPEGEVAVYVAHLASVRVGSEGFTADQRNRTIKLLGAQIAADPVKRVVLLGDLNGTVNDRSLAPITAGMRSAQGAAGHGFGFSWPARFPMARIDHILVRGVEPADAWVLPRTGSDHRPVAADLRLD